MKRKVVASAITLSIAILLSIGVNAYAAQVRQNQGKTIPTMENPDTSCGSSGATGGG